MISPGSGGEAGHPLQAASFLALSDSTKNYLTISSLEVNKYETLKAVIFSRLSDSPNIQVHKFLTGFELGDRSLSQLLRYMRLLGGLRRYPAS